MRLIDEEGVDLGVVPLQWAQEMATQKGLDLFFVQPDSIPPVARIMDYKRFKFEAEKRARETKKRHGIVHIKEIRMRYKIEEHDFQTKLRSARDFLAEKDKVKVLIVLRGRENEHKDIAFELLYRFANELKDLGMIDREPKLEGKSVIMVVSPISPGNRPSSFRFC